MSCESSTVLNLVIQRFWRWGGVVLNAEDENGQVKDLTGYEVYAQARDASGNLVADLEPEITDAEAGEITFPAWERSETDDWPEGLHAFDLMLVDPDGNDDGPYFTGSTIRVETPKTRPPEE